MSTLISKWHGKMCAFFLWVSVFLWFVVSAYGETEPAGKDSSLWIIVLLVGIIQALVGYVYISGQRTTQKSIEELKERIKEVKECYSKLDAEKLDKELHRQICPEDRP